MQDHKSVLLTISILGGTGKEGKGLVFRWAMAGYRVIIGSRSIERAKGCANELLTLLDGNGVIEGMSYQDAAKQADVVVLAVPYSAQREILEAISPYIQGKLLISIAVPLSPSKATRVQIPQGGSAAEEASAILGGNVQVCTAFQNISHEILMSSEKVDCDILVTGTSREARGETIKLIEAIGFNAWDAGPIENSIVVEGMTSLLIYINKKYNCTSAGIKITGILKDY
jgi:hypothetical protein